MSTRSQLTKDLNGLSSTECLRSYYGTVIHKKKYISCSNSYCYKMFIEVSLILILFHKNTNWIMIQFF